MIFASQIQIQETLNSKEDPISWERKRFSTNTPWEPIVGYSRAIRVGPHVHVSGTTATDPSGVVVARGDPFAQTALILRKLGDALVQVGSSLKDVVRTRIYVVNIEDWKEIARAHGEVFGKIRPATSMVEVKRLIDPAMLVEIEAEAIVDEP